MGAIGLLAETLQQTVENPALCQSGVEFPALRVKIREIELPGTDFHLALRRPLTLRIRHELAYWLVSDYKTTVWGTGETIADAIIDYMREWKEQLHWLEARRDEMGPGLIADYELLRKLVA